MTEPEQRDEFLLERLQESASGEAAVRQLRRRYDLLRQEYEALLDRLAELEERVERLSARPSARGRRPLVAAILHPLQELRDEYREALTVLDRVFRGLDELSEAVSSTAEPAAPEAPPAEAPERAEQPRKVQLQVRGGDFGTILDFQERISELEGVRRGSISAIDHERATLVVELEPADA